MFRLVEPLGLSPGSHTALAADDPIDLSVLSGSKKDIEKISMYSTSVPISVSMQALDFPWVSSPVLVAIKGRPLGT